jgi:hypothetical protein
VYGLRAGKRRWAFDSTENHHLSADPQRCRVLAYDTLPLLYTARYSHRPYSLHLGLEAIHVSEQASVTGGEQAVSDRLGLATVEAAADVSITLLRVGTHSTGLIVAPI